MTINYSSPNDNDRPFTDENYSAFVKVFDALQDMYPTIYTFRDAMIDAGAPEPLIRAMTNEWIARNV
jgi:hypothetical protein